jgi:hypothetical protein
LRDGFLLLGVVIFVEVVDVGLSGFDGFFFAGSRFFFAVGEGEIPAFTPLLDYFRFFFFADVGLVGGCEGRGACDGTAGCYALFGVH